MKKSILFMFIVLSIMCTSCYKTTVDEPILVATQTQTEYSSIEDTTLDIGISVENPKLYPSQIFKQMIKNINSVNITINDADKLYSKGGFQVNDIENLSAYFKECTYTEYPSQDIDYSGLHMLITFFVTDEQDNIYDSYSINIYDVSNIETFGNCIISIKSSNYNETNNYITNIDDIKTMFDDLKTVF